MTDHIGDVTQMIPMTQERLDEIKARCEAATPRILTREEAIHIVEHSVLATPGINGFTREALNAAYVMALADMRDIPALLAEVGRLRAEVERFRAKRNETIDAIENLMESCRACDMCALNESDDTCSDNGEGYCSPVWIGRKEG